MTALASVWVRGIKLELVRADQIISLAVEDPRAAGSRPAPITTILEAREHPAAGEAMFTLTAAVAGREDTVHLRSYKAADAVEAIEWLTKALARSAGRDEPVLFVYPLPGDGGDWDTQPSLPREWIV